MSRSDLDGALDGAIARWFESREPLAPSSENDKARAVWSRGAAALPGDEELTRRAGESEG